MFLPSWRKGALQGEGEGEAPHQSSLPHRILHGHHHHHHHHHHRYQRQRIRKVVVGSSLGGQRWGGPVVTTALPGAIHRRGGRLIEAPDASEFEWGWHLVVVVGVAQGVGAVPFVFAAVVVLEQALPHWLRLHSWRAWGSEGGVGAGAGDRFHAAVAAAAVLPSPPATTTPTPFQISSPKRQWMTLQSPFDSRHPWYRWWLFRCSFHSHYVPSQRCHLPCVSV